MAAITETIRQRSISQPSESSIGHLLAPRNLKDAVDIAIPVAQTPEDLNEQLKEAADDEYTQALRDNPELGEHPSLRARVIFMQTYLKLNENETAKLLGITANQVIRKDFRARRKDEIGKFEERLNNGVATANILLAEEPATVFNRRDAIRRKNGKISDFSIFTAMEAGFGNIAVAIAQNTVRQYQETMEHQRGD